MNKTNQVKKTSYAMCQQLCGENLGHMTGPDGMGVWSSACQVPLPYLGPKGFVINKEKGLCVTLKI
jgi:hypothetical protein